jgi:hypothetical protein
MAIISDNALFGIEGVQTLSSILQSYGSSLIANYASNVGLYKDNATPPTPCSANGDAVYQWQDQSGNGFTLSQTTLANRLSYYTAQQNGLPTVRLNGTSSFIENQSAMYSTWPAITAFVVIKPTTVSVAGTWIDAYNASTTVGRYLIRTGVTSGYVSWFEGTLTQGPAITASQFSVISAVFNGASSYCRINGGSDVGPSNIGTASSPFGGNGIRIGAGGAGGYFASGDIAEIVYASGALTSTARTAVENYLNTKWSVFNPNAYAANYLLVAGGGGGGTFTSGLTDGGGGGAGGVLTGSVNLSPGTSYPITVGTGGTANNNGSNSTGFSLTALGGGRGGYNNTAAGSGGSGGGGSDIASGGTGQTGQGYNGGSAAAYSGGGGGGAGGVGGNAVNSTSGGNGGVGISSSITGTATYYGGGGGGAEETVNGGTTPGTGGNGGGGNGSDSNVAGGNGTANTGGGGGGGSGVKSGGAGGSGVVILSVPTAKYTGTYTGTMLTGYPKTSGSNTILAWNVGSGSYTA